MLDGISKLKNKIKYYGNKKVMWLLLLWVATFTFILVILLSIIFHMPLIYASLIYFILLIALFFIVSITRIRVAYYDMYQRYYLLLESANPPLETKQLFDQKWLDKINKNDFKLSFSSDLFDIYYKISPNISKRSFRHNILETITLIKDSKIDLHNSLIEIEYEKILNANFKKNKINQQIMYQYKMYEEFNKQVKNELDQVIIFKQKKQCLIKINCGILLKLKLVYFLHSNKYYPNAYYKYAISEIKALVK